MAAIDTTTPAARYCAAAEAAAAAYLAAIPGTPTDADTAAAAVILTERMDAGLAYSEAVAQGYAWLCADCAHAAAGIVPEWPLPAVSVIRGRMYAAWMESRAITDARGRCDACEAYVGGLGGSPRERFDAPADAATALPMIQDHTEAAYALAEADATRHATDYAARQRSAGHTEAAEAPLSGEWADGVSSTDLGNLAAHAYGHADSYAWADADPEAPEALAAILDAWESAYLAGWPDTDSEPWERTASLGYAEAARMPAMPAAEPAAERAYMVRVLSFGHWGWEGTAALTEADATALADRLAALPYVQVARAERI